HEPKQPAHRGRRLLPPQHLPGQFKDGRHGSLRKRSGHGHQRGGATAALAPSVAGGLRTALMLAVARAQGTNNALSFCVDPFTMALSVHRPAPPRGPWRSLLMATNSIVRHGAMRFLGEFEPATEFVCARGQEVVVRTDRGLELGEVLCEASPRAVEYLV